MKGRVKNQDRNRSRQGSVQIVYNMTRREQSRQFFKTSRVQNRATAVRTVHVILCAYVEDK